MTAEEDAKNIVEFAVTKLEALPGDVVVVKGAPDWYAEHLHQMHELLINWAEHEGLNLHFLVVPHDVNLGIVHTLDPVELEKAGAVGWPHTLDG